jgi:hypothetical protein
MEYFFFFLFNKDSSKIAICFEVLLPIASFLHPPLDGSRFSSPPIPDPYPQNFEDDVLFDFMKKGDCKMICSDGSLKAEQRQIYLTSQFFREQMKNTREKEYYVDYSMDVMKPILIYLHSLCFEMPNVYDLEYAEQLLDAITFFEPIYFNGLELFIQKSLCNKFCTEVHSFESLLKWAEFVSHHSTNPLANDDGFGFTLYDLYKMIAALFANKYYLELHHRLERAERDMENPQFWNYVRQRALPRIEKTHEYGFLTNVIID